MKTKYDALMFCLGFFVSAWAGATLAFWILGNAEEQVTLFQILEIQWNVIRRLRLW